MSSPYQAVLDGLTRLRGVRGAMVITVADGLPVAESLMEGLKGSALAAMAATLASRAGDLAQRSGLGGARFLQLQASGGALLLATGGSELALVAVVGRDVPVGMVRLEMLRGAEQLT